MRNDSFDIDDLEKEHVEDQEETIEEDFSLDSHNLRKKLLLRVRIGLVLLVLFFLLKRFDIYNDFNPINGSIFLLIAIVVMLYCIMVIFVDSTLREHEYKKEITYKKLQTLDNVYDYISIVPYILFVFTLVNMFVFSFSPISGSSMEPNFSDDEAVIFSHLSDSYERLDVVIVYVEEFDDPYLIKRVIGLPNETITIDHNVITITDKSGNSFVLDEYFLEGTEVETICYNSVDRRTCSWELGDDEYFVLGDNRDGSADPLGNGGSSLDSRSFGEVYIEDIFGKVVVTFKDYNLLN